MFDIFTKYPSFAVFVAAVGTMFLTMLLMPAFIKFLQASKIGQQVRADGPESHLVKQGTPTMGGLIMILASSALCMLIALPIHETVALVIATLLTAALGFVDDISKVLNSRSLGLTPKAKLLGQFAIASAFCLFAVNMFDIAPTVLIPFIANIDLGVFTSTIPIFGGIDIPWLYLIFVDILLVGMCNAVNLTDGLDGLSSGTVMIVMLIMAVVAYRSDLLGPAVFAASLAGACVGFLWFNAHPADIFMGDTGSLSLGMGLGCLAIFTKTEFLVIIIGGLFVAEALSVLIQVFYYKRTKKRIFLMAPLHHHFEKKGWSETKVVVRFWIVSGIAAASGFTIYFAHSLIV